MIVNCYQKIDCQLLNLVMMKWGEDNKIQGDFQPSPKNTLAWSKSIVKFCLHWQKKDNHDKLIFTLLTGSWPQRLPTRDLRTHLAMAWPSQKWIEACEILPVCVWPQMRFSLCESIPLWEGCFTWYWFVFNYITYFNQFYFLAHSTQGFITKIILFLVQ